MAENVKKTENGFVRFVKRVTKFFRDCKGEVKKIVWPTPKAVSYTHLTGSCWISSSSWPCKGPASERGRDPWITVP